MADNAQTNAAVDKANAEAHAKLDQAAGEAKTLIERAQEEAKGLLAKARDEAVALFDKTVQAAKDNPKVAAGIAAGAAATIAGGAYAATKLKSSAKRSPAPRAPRKTTVKATPKKS